MYTIKTLNAISPVGLAKLNNKQFDVAVDTDAPDGILVRSADMLNTAFNDNLLAIARAGAGVNNIPLDRCSEKGIVVFNTPGANSNAVAEEVIAMMLAASRHLIPADISTRKGDWEKSKFMGRELTGKTVGILGLGHIGQLRHPAQPHWPAAQQGRCQQRQHTVLGRRDPYRSIQRPPARDDVIPCHAKTPVLPKIPHGMQNEGRRFPVLYPDTAKRICPVVCLFFASFAGQTSHFAAEMAAFMFPRGRRTARCPSRPAASSGWCRRRRKRAG